MLTLAWQITTIEQRNSRRTTLTFFAPWLKLWPLAMLTSGEHSPTPATLRKEAKAAGFGVEIHLVRAEAGPNVVAAHGGTAGGASGRSHSAAQG
jgi:hypothetical protein